jgi:hypothetical protein
MKKLALTVLALAAGIALIRAQGTISINTTLAEVYTNDGMGDVGPITGAVGSYLFEVLDMTQSMYASLTAQEQAAAYNLLEYPSDVSLWTDSGVSGANAPLHPGGINSPTATANNWAAPSSGMGYSTAGSYDYYTIVGWSANMGPNWSTVSSELGAATLFGWFGQTGLAYNYAGDPNNAPFPPVNLFSSSAATGLAGSGGLPSVGITNGVYYSRTRHARPVWFRRPFDALPAPS